MNPSSLPQTALRQERKMCAVMIDTLGREIMIRRQFKLDDMGWPLHDAPLLIPAGSTVTVTTRPVADATETVLPITYERFTEMVQPGDILYIGRWVGAQRWCSLAAYLI
jgi:pyruvate kinase